MNKEATQFSNKDVPISIQRIMSHAFGNFEEPVEALRENNFEFGSLKEEHQRLLVLLVLREFHDLDQMRPFFETSGSQSSFENEKAKALLPGSKSILSLADYISREAQLNCKLLEVWEAILSYFALPEYHSELNNFVEESLTDGEMQVGNQAWLEVMRYFQSFLAAELTAQDAIEVAKQAALKAIRDHRDTQKE